MSSNWTKEIRAIFMKELKSEWRSPHAFLTGILFGIISIVAISIAAFNIHVSPTLAAGLLWTIFLFTVVGTLGRVMIAEEESGTADLLRLVSRPHSVYWGKQLFNFIQTLAYAVLLTALYILFNGVHIAFFGLMVASLFAGSVALSGAVTFSGALAARAANRQALAASLALPLMIPVATWGETSLRVAFGEGFYDAGRLAALGLFCYGVVESALGPYLYAALWKK